MFNFDFTFLNGGLPVADIIVGGLTVAGTAAATYLAAKHTGKNANEIAEINNEFQERQLYESKKEDALIKFLITFNSIAYNIEDFYSVHKDEMRIKSFTPSYHRKHESTSPKHRSYIDHTKVTVDSVNALGIEILNQTSEMDDLYLTISNDLFRIKKYIKEDDFKNVEEKLNNIIHYFKHIRTNAYSFSQTTRLNNHLMAIQLVHLTNDIGEIKFKRKENPGFTTTADPYLQALFKLEEFKNPIKETVEKYM